jgi:ubiquinone/menaquinone biosynthesis C-methylase UbiE
MDQETAIKLHYDTFAEEYDAVDQAVGHLLAELDVRHGSSLLDIGCATGNLTLRLPEVCSPRKVVGVDLSSKALRIARTHAQEMGLDTFEFLGASARQLPFGDRSFDLVVSNIVFHLIPDQERALGEVVRILRPSGSAVLQFLGGGEVMPEMTEVISGVWSQVLPGTDAPQLFYRLNVEDIAECLSDLGVDDFEITWRKRVMRIGETQVERYLDFFRLVGHFWRWSLDAETADSIEERVVDEVMNRVKREGCFVNTANHLLLKFTRPSPTLPHIQQSSASSCPRY